MHWLLIISLFWLLCLTCLWLWKSSLLIKTWQEPYFADTAVLIESDDWGPGGDFHAARLKDLTTLLERHKDSIERTAILTADIVLAIPDVVKIKETNNNEYFRKTLDSFPGIYKTMLAGMQQGTFVPQLHGLEHLNGKVFANLIFNQDPRIKYTQETNNWWDWETLDSPLQGHYVDGRSLPTRPISKKDAEQIINTATNTFQQLFNIPSYSTVAPCYLWGDEIEQLWSKQGIQAIQTAGYRCTVRDGTGKYTQNPALIRVGDKNIYGQVYLVRNVMYEPVDGKNTAETAYKEALAAFRQALPISISTHRYNYTRGVQEHKTSLAGLNTLLKNITQKLPDTRFISSPELALQIETNDQAIINQFNQSKWPALKKLKGCRQLSAFLYRLYNRHPKLVLASYVSGLIIPAWIVCKTSTPRIKI